MRGDAGGDFAGDLGEFSFEDLGEEVFEFAPGGSFYEPGFEVA